MLKNYTPQTMLCHTDNCCPAILINENNDFVVIGKHTTPEARAEIASQIASDEETVTLPRELILGWLEENWSELEAEVKNRSRSAA